jgi:nucleotide-binding universal stress UspA family protein
MVTLRDSVGKRTKKDAANREILRRSHKDDFHEQREHDQERSGILRRTPAATKPTRGRPTASRAMGRVPGGVRKIAVATDLSLASRRAVDLAVELSIRLGAELVVVHCVEAIVPPYPIPLTLDLATLTAAARRTLDTELKRVREALPGARKKLLQGCAVERIAAFVAESEIDLLVFGTTDATRSGLLGNAAEKVTESTDVPVLVVRAKSEWLG